MADWSGHRPSVRQWTASGQPGGARYRFIRTAGLAQAALVLLFACGGGGGGSDPAPPPPAGTGAGTDTPASTAGCAVEVDGGPFEPAWPGLDWESRSPESQGLCPDDIDSAMDYAFKAGNDTGAVLVVRNGYIVAERYSADREAADLATSWSVAKSLASALVGAALDDGLILNLDQKISEFVPAWRETDKSEITLEHLMTLRTALETVSGTDLYNAQDQLQFSLDRELIGEPGEKHYDYSNADVMIAGEVLNSATGMPAGAYLDQRIGAAIGFSGDWWTDGAGHMLTYCCLDATPRRFARFGLLFARGGEWNGTTVLSSNWIEKSTGPALEGEYRFYWWSAGSGGFGAFGLHGQIVAVYPEADLVVTRFSRYTKQGDGRAVREGDNYHGTEEPDDFDNATFLEMMLDSLADE